MPESRVPVAKQHLTAAAVSLFNEALETGGVAPPNVERAAHLVDEALAELDAARQLVDVRPAAPEDWQAA